MSKKFSVRVFDTILNRRHRNTADRNYADVWRAFAKISGWECYHERMHSLADVKYFLRKPIKESVVIFSGHGESQGLMLSNGECLSPEEVSELSGPLGTEGKIIILSTCKVGNYPDICNKYKDAFGASHLFAYRYDMHDQYCFLYDSLLLTMLSQHGKVSDKIMKDYEDNTFFMKNMNQKGVRKHPLVYY